MTEKDRQRLRELAKKQMDFAQSESNRELVALWRRHNSFMGERPLIHIEVGTFQQEVIAPLLQCEDGFARGVEYNLLHNVVNAELFGDDRPVAPYYQLSYPTWFHLFGQQLQEDVITDASGLQMGHKFAHSITDLQKDFAKILEPSTFGVNKGLAEHQKAILEDIFADILPVKLTMGSLYAVPTQKVVHMMGMQAMLFAMYDYPDAFQQMMARIAEDYIAYFHFLQAEGYLLPTTAYESLAQGSFCFWEEEPAHTPPHTSDVWGFMDSQETVGLSPEMFREFIFPCYRQIGALFGRLSYGCCEPVHTFWEDIKTFSNLKKVSVSPWCDEAFMAEQLRGQDIIFHRKPSPNYLGVGNTLDEDAFRAHIEHTIKTARGCHLEITQRDVYTVNHDIRKVRRYVEIIRESIAQHWA